MELNLDWFVILEHLQFYCYEVYCYEVYCYEAQPI